MNQPLVSVIVATYRRDESLRNALQSLKIQTYENYEVIVVDDNDDLQWNETVRTIIADAGLPVQLIENHPNLGSAKARNAGIETAQGEYITFLDDDDLYLPEKIEKQVATMVETKADYCITDLDLYSESDKLIERRVRDYIKSTQPEQLMKYHLMYHMTGTDTMMFRAEYLRVVGNFPPIDVGDEFYLMAQAITSGGKFYYLPGCDVKAYVHTGEDSGLSSGESKIRGENALHEYKKQFFAVLDAQSRRYIKMRHHAVLAFAGLRLRKWFFVFKNSIISFLSDPINCLRLLSARI